MTPAVGLSLTVGAALCWGLLDALRKRLARDMEALPLTTWLLLGQWPVFGTWVAATGESRITADWLPPGLAVSALALVAAVLFVQAVRVSPLSVVVPMLSFTPAFAVLTGGLFVGEWPTWTQTGGIAIVVSGALGLAAADRRAGGRGLREPGLWMMIAVALLWACTIALDKVALQHADVPAHALAQGVTIGVGLLLLLAVRGELALLGGIRGQLGPYLLAVVLQCLATALQLVAITAMLVGVVEGVKRSLGLAMAVLNGWLWFDEKVGPGKLVAVAWMGLGALLLVS
ncbi:MAG: drug/metabolite transporter (DMT)-like permease [Myxococcota bacterium]